MTLTELRFIVALAQERNFRKAAEKSFVTQPALSLAIKKLEDELGVLIFERNHGEVGITGIGEKIVEQANRALEEVARIKELEAQGANQLADRKSVVKGKSVTVCVDVGVRSIINTKIHKDTN